MMTIDANDAFAMDWTNPTAHMLAGKQAGYKEGYEQAEADSRETVKDLLSVLKDARFSLAHAAAMLDEALGEGGLSDWYERDLARIDTAIAKAEGGEA